jgi:cell division transport system ATP-binding protein
MLKREDPDLYADGVDDTRAAVLDRPPTGDHPVYRPAPPTRGERLDALVAEDEVAPRVPQRPGAPMIVFDKVTKVYAHQVVGLQDVSLTIDKGEWIFLVGPSGSGKSTFIRLLLKELDPTEGTVIVGGRSLSKLRRSKVPQLRRNIGCVFQDFKLLPNRTVYQNVAYALEVQGQPKRVAEQQVPEILQLVGLGHKIEKFPHELSGGEQQRVSIARAFVNHPPLLICDEPTGNLDPDTSVGIMQLLYRINRTGTTVVMATHDREMVDRMRRRVIALERGKLVRDSRRGGYVEA